MAVLEAIELLSFPEDVEKCKLWTIK